MKSFLKKITVFLLLAVTCFSAFACSNGNENKVTIDYGAVYNLPVGGGAEVTVLDPSGKKVSVYNDAFVPNKTGNYTMTVNDGSKLTTTVLEVKDLSAPKISAEYERKYAVAGGKISLPQIVVTDNYDTSVSYKAYLVNGSMEILVTDSMVFGKTGVSEVVISATDKAGNTAKKKIEYIVVDKLSDELSTVAEFGTERGKEYIYDARGYDISYQTEIKHDCESGATRLKVNGESETEVFRLRNALIKNITEYSSLYLYIYNDSEISVDLSLNYNLTYSLAPKAWTEINIEDYAELENSELNGTLAQTFSATNLDGLTFTTSGYEKGEDQPEISLYLSNMYALPFATAGDIVDRINALPETLDEDDMPQINSIFRLFGNIAASEKEKITNWSEFSAKYRRDFYETEYPTTPADGKAYHFDSPYGELQVKELYGEAGSKKFVPASYEFSTERAHDGEAGSLKITADKFAWNLFFYLGFSDLNTTGYTEMSFFVYFDFCDSMTISTTVGEIVVSGKGEWREVVIPLATIADLNGEQLYIYFNNWGIGIEEGQSFYFSSVKFS